MKYLLICFALAAGFAVQAQDFPEQVTHFPGDLSNDSVVGTDDLMLLLSLWGLLYEELLPCFDEVAVDYDGYEYELVSIGGQCWFAENLRTEHYANGDTIPGNLNGSEWASTSSGAQTVYGEGLSTVYDGSEDEVVNLATYGRLYNWYAVDDARGLCPSGWHVPTDGEWMTLEMELGMSSSEANSTGWRGIHQGHQMKSSSSDTPSWNGSNVSGFSALPGGYRLSSSGAFSSEGVHCHWWSASSDGTSSAWFRNLFSYYFDVSRHVTNTWSGFSVRCVRD